MSRQVSTLRHGTQCRQCGLEIMKNSEGSLDWGEGTGFLWAPQHPVVRVFGHQPHMADSH